MSNSFLLKKLKEHHLAAQIAVFLICCTAIIAIPEGVSFLDLSTEESRSAIINSEGNVFKIYKWEYSVFIRKTNGICSFDRSYGLPDLVLLDPGEHNLEITCRGRILNIGWIKSEFEIKIELEANKVYKLEARRASSNLSTKKCVVQLFETEKRNSYQATDQQFELLTKAGF